MLVITIANALSKQRKAFILLSLQKLSQFQNRTSRQVEFSSFVIPSNRNRKRTDTMICMRRGLWASVSRQNQAESRDFDSHLTLSAAKDTEQVVSSSSSYSSSKVNQPDELMPAAGEIESGSSEPSPTCKRARLISEEDENMPTISPALETNSQSSQPADAVDEVFPVLRWAKITENAIAPKKGSEFAAGFDLYSAYDCSIPAQGTETVMTDIQIDLPKGCYGRVAPRSGLARHNFIDVGAGVIDRDYRGNVGVVMFNHGPKEFKVEKGMRIAQLICERICYPKLELVTKLGETKRGSGGYGSTGTN